MNNKDYLSIEDDVSGLKIYEIINKYFGKNYTGWMKAWFKINEEYAAWFPIIYTSNVRPDGEYGGTQMWSNTLSNDMKTITEMNHDVDQREASKIDYKNAPKRLVFARINGSFKFLGVFKTYPIYEAECLARRHERIATAINLKTMELINEEIPLGDINTPMRPIRRIRKANGSLLWVCPRCSNSFELAPRCPECGQLIKYQTQDNTSVSGDRRVVHIGDNVSNLRIYEIINKYFGKNYTGWMKASFDINDEYWAWFPKIYVNNIRPDGNYGGTVMWSNTVTPDKKVVISVDHDRLTKDLSKEELNRKLKKVLIFARINGAFEFLGVFDDKLVLESELVTYRHDRIAEGIDLSTFELIHD